MLYVHCDQAAASAGITACHHFNLSGNQIIDTQQPGDWRRNETVSGGHDQQVVARLPVTLQKFQAPGQDDRRDVRLNELLSPLVQDLGRLETERPKLELEKLRDIQSALLVLPVEIVASAAIILAQNTLFDQKLRP